VGRHSRIYPVYTVDISHPWHFILNVVTAVFVETSEELKRRGWNSKTGLMYNL